MHVVRTPGSARAIARTLPRPVAFVPTMGALHSGHLALVERAKRESAVVAASIFVNPLQFGRGEDFQRYPRDVTRDGALLEERGVELLYLPTAERMYPEGFASHINVGPLAARFEGAVRPGHFDGVVTVVSKLLHAIEPTMLYLGQKDAQQAAVVRRMVTDLDMAVDVIICATQREPDGLALSSRNAYLSAEERAAAPSLYQALSTVASAVTEGAGSAKEAVALGRALLAPPLRWEYLSVVDPFTFEPLESATRPSLVIGAVRGRLARLIDNVSVVGIDGRDPIVTPERSRGGVVRT